MKVFAFQTDLFNTLYMLYRIDNCQLHSTVVVYVAAIHYSKQLYTHDDQPNFVTVTASFTYSAVLTTAALACVLYPRLAALACTVFVKSVCWQKSDTNGSQ